MTEEQVIRHDVRRANTLGRDGGGIDPVDVCELAPEVLEAVLVVGKGLGVLLVEVGRDPDGEGGGGGAALRLVRLPVQALAVDAAVVDGPALGAALVGRRDAEALAAGERHLGRQWRRGAGGRGSARPNAVRERDDDCPGKAIGVRPGWFGSAGLPV
ncbi:unnamed protein product [Sphagnum tenellum]